jgi:Ca-activated chloride channel homolog
LITDILQHISFAHRWFFALFALIPVLIIWYRARYTRNQASFMVSTVDSFSNTGWKTRLRNLPFLLRILALSTLIIALARPQTRNDQQINEGDGVDIMLCLDASGSMVAQDLLPNRLEAAKQVAANFVDSRPGDRFGLVVFSGESFTQCPITSNKPIVKAQLNNINIGFMEPGTAIGSGLATSVERLKTSEAKSKVVILLTDGENTGGLIDPKTAKEIAKYLKIRVYHWRGYGWLCAHSCSNTHRS